MPLPNEPSAVGPCPWMTNAMPSVGLVMMAVNDVVNDLDVSIIVVDHAVPACSSAVARSSRPPETQAEPFSRSPEESTKVGYSRLIAGVRVVGTAVTAGLLEAEVGLGDGVGVADGLAALVGVGLVGVVLVGVDADELPWVEYQAA